MQYVEFHVDDRPTFLAVGAEVHGFGGNLSIRMPADVLPIMIFGQDEATFKQYLAMWKALLAPGGLKPLIPKDNGFAVMILAIMSRKVGFGVEWTEDLQRRVNEYRWGKKYCNSEAAIKLHESAIKKDLTSSPFIVEFKYGASNEGYWR